MKHFAVDFGSFSLKIIEFKSEKKSISVQSIEEIVLDLPENFNFNLENIWALQFNALVDFLSSVEEDYQIIMNMNSEIISTRNITLPVKNKKKAALMLPFQIEEDLPYSLSDCHFVETIETEGNQNQALAGIIKKSHFEEIYARFLEHNIKPNILTYDAPVYHTYMKNNADNYDQAVCILEFGHDATRGYFFYDGQLVSNHHSFVAGKSITEEIANTYSISNDEATIYKHQNGYVLNEEQFDQVNDNQREFAKLMHSTLRPLLNEIRRWEIGFQVKHGVAIKEYLICGGTANLNNFSNYLAAELGASIQFFNPYTSCHSKKVDEDERIRNKFSYCTLLAQSHTYRNNVINFLKGEYAFLSNNILPLENILFRASRLLILCLLISSYFLIDSIFINKQIKTAQKFVSKKVLSAKDRSGENIFSLPPREKRQVKSNPAKILAKLKKQENIIQEEVKLIQSSLRKNAMLPLNELSTKLSGKNAEIVQFHSESQKDFSLIIRARDKDSLNQIADSIEDSEVFDISSDIDEEKLEISVNGQRD